MKLKSPLLVTVILTSFLFLFLSINFTLALTGSIGNARMILYPEVGFLGTTLEESVIVNNVNSVPVNVTLETSKNFTIANIIDKSFILEPHSTKEAQFQLKIRKEGNYSGTINVFFRPVDGNGAGVVLSSTIIVHAVKKGFFDSNNSTDDSEELFTDDGSDNGNNDDSNNTPLNIPIGLIIALGFLVFLVIVFIFLLIWSKKVLAGNRAKKEEAITVKYKKYALFLLLLVGILFIFSFASAKDIAYVVEGAQDNNIIVSLNNMGYSYDIISNTAIPLTNFSKYGMLLIQGNPISSSFLPLTTKNSLFIVDSSSSSVVSTIWPTASLASTQTAYSKLDQLNTPFTNGFNSQDIQVYSSSQDAYYLRIKPSYVNNIASSIQTQSFGKAFIAYSNQNNRRNVYFGLPLTDFWTSDDEKLFNNSVRWIRVGVDMDGDGFFSDTDCNDNNASINPNALEIPYDGVDENCDNIDMADVDMDGYCKGGYTIQNKLIQCAKELGSIGTDCNDVNLTINPNATEIMGGPDRNCKDENPLFVENIANLTWLEDNNMDKAFNLNDYFKSIDGNHLTFSIFSTTSDKNITTIIDLNGTVSFEVNANWNGVDWVIFKANDSQGYYNISNKIYLNVTAVNDAPVLSHIPGMAVDEEQIVSIIANATDVDNWDNLNYSINNARFVKVQEAKSGSIFRWQTNYTDSGTYNVNVSVRDSNGLIDSQEVEIIIRDKNIAPVLEDIAGITLNEDNGYSFIVNVTDVDNSILTYRISNENISQVNCNVNSNGNISLMPALNWFGNTSCSLQVSDGNSTITKSFNITVNPVNDAPVISLIGNRTLRENETLEFTLNATDVEEDSLSYSFVGLPDGANFDSLTRTFSWTPNFTQAGTYDVKFIVNDGKLNATEDVAIRVLNYNRLPVLKGDIPPLSWDEDGYSETLNLAEYFSDVDSDNLTFSVNLTGEEKNITLLILGNLVNFTSSLNWYGQDFVIFQARDNNGGYVLSNRVNLTVNPVPDAPILSPIADINAVEGNNVIIISNATDAEGDILYYSINDSRFTNNTLNTNGRFTWLTNYSDSGVYYFNVSVTDGFFKDSQVVRINVNDTNEPPHIGLIADVEIEEDSDWTTVLNVSAYDNDGNITNFTVVSQDKNKVECRVDSIGNIEVRPAINWFGIGTNAASCSIAAIDDLGASSNTSFKINVINTPDAPIINSYSPLVNPRLLNTSSQLFTINPIDPDGDLLNIFWFLGESLVNSNSQNYIFTPHNSGSYNVSALVTDGTFNVTQDWNVFVGNIKDFTCEEVNGFICQSNEICNTQTLDTSDSSETNICCSMQCSIRPPEFRDADKCDGKKNKDLELEIIKPENGKEFEFGEEIKVKVKVTNEGNEDEDVNLLAYLYDLTEDDSIDDMEDSIDVDSGDSETMTFNFNASNDLDTDHDYAIYVIADGDNSCNNNFVLINLKRKNNDLEFKSLNIDNENPLCGEVVNVQAKIKNMGSKNQNVYWSIVNTDLNISERLDVFQLEKYDKDDEVSKDISFTIPQDAVAGSYSIKLRLAYGDETTETTRDITIGDCKKEESSSKTIEVSKPTKIENKQIKINKVDKLTPSQMMLILISVLILCIIVTSIIIMVVVRKY